MLTDCESCSGFTLVEVLVAAVIFTLCVAVIANSFANSTSRLVKDRQRLEKAFEISRLWFEIDTEPDSVSLEESEEELLFTWNDTGKEEEVSREAVVSFARYKGTRLLVDVREAGK